VIPEAKIGFLANLQVLVAPIASAVSIPITAPEPSGSALPEVDQVPPNSETTHIGQVQMKSNSIADQSEPELSGSDNLFFDSEPTRMGRKRRCRDISGLSLCLCGVSVPPDEEGSVQCQKAGCEMIWVSDCVDFAHSRLNQVSIIFGVLGMRTKD